MDLASIIGIVSGIGFVCVTILLGSGMGLFWNLPSVMIVFGGTIAATMIAYPLSDFLGIIKVTMKVFLFKIEKNRGYHCQSCGDFQQGQKGRPAVH